MGFRRPASECAISTVKASAQYTGSLSPVGAGVMAVSEVAYDVQSSFEI